LLKLAAPNGHGPTYPISVVTLSSLRIVAHFVKDFVERGKNIPPNDASSRNLAQSTRQRLVALFSSTNVPLLSIVPSV
jgi:hypothetical protein